MEKWLKPLLFTALIAYNFEILKNDVIDSFIHKTMDCIKISNEKSKCYLSAILTEKDEMNHKLHSWVWLGECIATHQNWLSVQIIIIHSIGNGTFVCDLHLQTILNWMLFAHALKMANARHFYVSCFALVLFSLGKLVFTGC